jgi:hypothetical protein
MSESCPRTAEVLELKSLSAELEEHVAGCESCRKAHAVGSTLGAAQSRMDEQRLAQMRAALNAEAQVPGGSQWRRWAAALMALEAAACLASWATGSRDAIADLSPLSFWALAGLCAAVVFAGTWLALAPARQGATRWALGFGLLAALLVGAMSSESVPPGMFWASAIPCGPMEALISLAPAALALFILTASAPRFDRSLLAGLAAGAVGIFFLHFHCSLRASAHLFAFHVAPWLAIAFAVAGIRARLRSRTFAP